jgi:hypothetical protein
MHRGKEYLLLPSLIVLLSLPIVVYRQDLVSKPVATPAPQTELWKSEGEPLRIESVPPLVPLWSIDLKTITHSTDSLHFITGIALTEQIAVVSYCSPSPAPGCAIGELFSYDLKTGKQAESVEWSRNAKGSTQPYIFGGRGRAFLLYDDDILSEFDGTLKKTDQIALPRGMSLTQRPGYGYGLWADTTKTTCKRTEIAVYVLNEKRNLNLGCGHEVAVTDEKWRPLFSERYIDPNAVVSPDFSQDGNRFVLKLNLHYSEPPLNTVISYLLYDLRDKTPRKIVFSVQNAPATYMTGISPDGSVFGVVGQDKLSMYSLPK